MRVSVLGHGAVGSLLGGLAAAEGHAVSFLSRRARRGAAPYGDLRLVLPGGWVSVRDIPMGTGLAAPPGGLGPDLLVVCLGRHHLRELKPGALSGLCSGGTHVALCNAEPEEAGRLGVPADRGSRCVTLFNALSLQEGDVELLTESPVLVVETDSRAEEAFRPLSRWGFRLHPVKDATSHGNSLFVFGLLFLPAALCNTTIPHFLSFPEGREVARMVLKEGLETMEKTGRGLARLPLMDPAELAVRLRRSRDDGLRARFLPDRAYPPVLSAYLRGRPGESRELNRRLVEMAAGAGLHLTWNWQLFQKAGRPASVGFYRDPAELLASMA